MEEIVVFETCGATGSGRMSTSIAVSMIPAPGASTRIRTESHEDALPIGRSVSTVLSVRAGENHEVSDPGPRELIRTE